MSRILYLILILFFTILFSSIVKYEHFSSTFNIKFNSTISGDGNVQIINETDDNMWIILTKNSQPWNSITDDWDFHNNGDVVDGVKIGNGDSMMYFGPILNNNTFSCKYTKSGDPSWESGECNILNIDPTTVKIDEIEGLTALEWTFKPGSNFMPDISALDGINIKVTMDVKNGVNCKGNTNKKCKINFGDPMMNQYIDKTKSIKSIKRPQWDPADIESAGNDDAANASKCGLSDNQNCITCPFDYNPCGDNVPLTDPCYLDSIKAKWGCYKWWANPKNTKAQNWLNVYKTGEGCNDSYRWVFDETGIYLPNDKDELNTLNKPFMETGEIWDETSTKYLCSISTDMDFIKENCEGYPVTKIDGPNANCARADNTTQVIFTIHDILS